MFGYGIDNQRHIVNPTGIAMSRANTMPATAPGGAGPRSAAEVRARPTSPNSNARIATTELSRNARKPQSRKRAPVCRRERVVMREQELYSI
jgi:hypothetical protein